MTAAEDVLDAIGDLIEAAGFEHERRYDVVRTTDGTVIECTSLSAALRCLDGVDHTYRAEFYDVYTGPKQELR